MIIKHGGHIFGEIHEVRKGLWASFLDCAFGMLIGWADKFQIIWVIRRSRTILTLVSFYPAIWNFKNEYIFFLVHRPTCLGKIR